MTLVPFRQANPIPPPASWVVQGFDVLAALKVGNGSFTVDDSTQGALVAALTAFPGVYRADGSGPNVGGTPEVSNVVLTTDRRVTRRSSPATNRLKTRNDHPNPRAVSLTGWSKVDPTGATSVSWTDVDDADFASVGSTAAGHCAEYSFTHDGSAGRVLEIQTIPSTGVIVTVPSPTMLVFHRASVKQVAAPVGAGDVPVTLLNRQYTNTPTLISSILLQTKKRISGSPLMAVEGFDGTAGTTVRVASVLQFALPAVAGVYTFRVGRAQTVVDPLTEVPSYGDGSIWNWTWFGSANGSASDGWGDEPSGGLLYTGFNDNSQAATRTYGGQSVLSASQVSALMVEGGFNLTRFGIDNGVGGTLDSVSPSAGNYNWRTGAPWVAALLDSHRAAGVKAMPIMAPPRWMTTGSTGLLKDVPSSNYAAFAALYNALVAEWPDVIVALELWNEPNLSDALSWGAAADAAKYTDVLVGIYSKIKAQSSVKVVAGALACAVADDATGQTPATYLAAMYAAGAKDHMDAVSVHPYPYAPTTALPSVPSGLSNGFDKVMLDVREAKRAAGDLVPIWITEVGGISSAAGWSELYQAQAMLMIKGLARRAGDVEALVFHTLTSDTVTGTSVRDYEFLEYKTLRRKAVWDALKTGLVPGGVWRPLSLSNSWASYTASGGPDPFPSYMKDPDTGIVRVRGAVKNGSSATAVIATLPSGYRPRYMKDQTASQSSAAVGNISSSATEPALIRVNTSGTIVPVANTSTTYLQFNLDFPAEN